MYDFFLSHSWGDDSDGRDNHARVGQINDELKKHGFETWFDQDRLAGDIGSLITEGMSKSEFIIIFLTKSYMEKVVNVDDKFNWCRQECLYAIQNKPKNRLILVSMDTFMSDKSNWADGFKLYFDGSQLFLNFNKSLKIKMLLEDVKKRQKLSKGDNMSDLALKVNVAIDKWTITPQLSKLQINDDASSEHVETMYYEFWANNLRCIGTYTGFINVSRKPHGFGRGEGEIMMNKFLIFPFNQCLSIHVKVKKKCYYEGEWLDGMMNGNGKLVYGDFVFIGTWLNGNLHGTIQVYQYEPFASGLGMFLWISLSVIATPTLIIKWLDGGSDGLLVVAIICLACFMMYPLMVCYDTNQRLKEELNVMPESNLPSLLFLTNSFIAEFENGKFKRFIRNIDLENQHNAIGPATV